MRRSVYGCLGAVSQRLRLDEVLMYYRAQRVQDDVMDEAEESITGASIAAAAHDENDTQGVNAQRDLDVGEAGRQDKATAVEEVASKQLDAPTAEKTSTLLDEAIQTGQEVQESLAGGERAVEEEEMECERARPSPTTGGPARPSPTSGGLLPQLVVPAAASAKEEEGYMMAELVRTHTSRPHQQNEVSGRQMQMATTFPRKEERLEAASAAAETASDSFVRMGNDSLQSEKRSIGEEDVQRMQHAMWEQEKHERVRSDVQLEKDNEGESEMEETAETEEKKNQEIVAKAVLLRIEEVQAHARLEKKTGEKMKNEEEKETEKEVEMVVAEERLRIEEVQAHVPQLRENEVQACVPQLRESKVQAHMSEQPRTQASGCTSLMPQQPLAHMLQQPLPHSAARRVSFKTAEETGQMTREILAHGVENARVLACLDGGGGAGERDVALRFALQAAAAQEDAQEAWDAREHWRRDESRALATIQDLREQERAASAVAAAARHEAEGAAIAQHAYALARGSDEEARGRAAAAAAVKEWQAAASTKEFEHCRRVDWDTSTGEFESGPLTAANQSRSTWYQGHQHGEVPVSYHMGIVGVVDGFLPGTSSSPSRMQHFPKSTTVGMGTYTAQTGQRNVTRAGRRGANNIAASLHNRNSAEAMALSVW